MSDNDYKVGKGKPPKHSQFQPGQSGNPKGRPKRAKNIATDLAEELDEMMSYSKDGKKYTCTKQRGIVKAQIAKAIKGSTQSAALVLLKLAPEAEAVREKQDWIRASEAVRTARAIMEKRFRLPGPVAEPNDDVDLQWPGDGEEL